MRGLMPRKLGAIAVAFALLVVTPTAVSPQVDASAQQDVVRRPMAQALRGRGAMPFARTELFFGTAKPDGTAVTDAEFDTFLNEQITPRFPDGLTLVTALGQFRGESGLIVKEKSFLLILLYPVETARQSGRRIEVIRQLYREMFQQESVLRADDPLPSWISF
jgi:Protein of unknown function (DUF3574)